MTRYRIQWDYTSYPVYQIVYIVFQKYTFQTPNSLSAECYGTSLMIYQVLARGRQATSNYANQSLLRFISSYSVIKPQLTRCLQEHNKNAYIIIISIVMLTMINSCKCFTYREKTVLNGEHCRQSACQMSKNIVINTDPSMDKLLHPL